MSIRSLVELIARYLVDHPAEVVVTEVKGHQLTVLELYVSKTDIGQMIGKYGRTVQAWRTIVSACSAKDKKRFVLEVADRSDHLHPKQKKNAFQPTSRN